MSIASVSPIFLLDIGIVLDIVIISTYFTNAYHYYLCSYLYHDIYIKESNMSQLFRRLGIFTGNKYEIKQDEM